MEIITKDHPFAAIWEKVQREERLTFEDGVKLMSSNDITALGYMANYVREKKHGDKTFFNTNRHINPTNICQTLCDFCAFGVRMKDPAAYTMTMEEVEHRIDMIDPEATEVHIVGGNNPALRIDYYENILRKVKEKRPNLHVKALTGVEIDHFTRVNKMTAEEVLDRLIAAGLDSMPGGGAEIFAEEPRSIICDHKTSGERWLEIHEIAHKKGLRTNSTMLYNHVESLEDRIDHMIRLRDLQDKTGGFQTFIPLSWHPDNTELIKKFPHLHISTGFEDLKVIAVARLMLDNIDHIKTYWMQVGEKLAQTALWFGADDLDGNVVEEKIYHAAGAQTSQGMAKADLVKLIRDAGRMPVERDTLYNVVNTDFSHLEGKKTAPVEELPVL
ncbi:de-hypoxanthine futalosine cyclase [Tumebacillus sp. BK434]|uniref:aminofutalosine synthase MqnE n=1 Tax=Tumebacillus sp. BK434 TaxID=2512169 RepID=UPI00104CABEB|nr:aminofutalosine synthase MqnE [Tumebacillus sp. BK434]TCP59346.1 de-hypoxanthine futalosine cyclase [Tumebacillus sp. BK434]